MTLGIMVTYVLLLLGVGIGLSRWRQATAGEYFLASRGIGSFMLLMSLFGTAMTAFALVGSTGESFETGIGVYGMLASWSGILHSACFFLVAPRVWALGRRHGYLTQIAFFRDRYRSEAVALVLFPVLVALVTIYVLMGVVGAGRTIAALTPETFARSGVVTRTPLAAAPADLAIPEAWRERLHHDAEAGELVLRGSLAAKRGGELRAMASGPAWEAAVAALVAGAPRGGVPYSVGMAAVCLVVLLYVSFGGMRATAWANTFQTLVFMATGVIAWLVIARALGGPVAATARLLESAGADRAAREGLINRTAFLTYGLIPLSIGTFPHIFQHWLTARRASTFKLSIVAHPVCILITWLPCVLLGMWAAAILPLETHPNAVLGILVDRFSGDILSGLIGAGILAAIMSSMDSQFLCLGSLFTNDIVAHYFRRNPLDDQQRVLCGRLFVGFVVLVACAIGWFEPGNVFDLGVWCFSGFASLFPVTLAALYWPRSNKYGVLACVLVVALLWLCFLPEALRGDTVALNWSLLRASSCVGGVVVTAAVLRRAHGAAAFLLTVVATGLLWWVILRPGFAITEESALLEVLPVTYLFGTSVVVLVAVTLLTPPPDAALRERFFGSGPR